MATEDPKESITLGRKLTGEHTSISAFIVAIIYGLLVNFLAYGILNPLFVIKIESIKIGGRALLATILGTGIFSVKLGFVYVGIFLMIISTIMLIFHLPASHYVSALTAAYLLLLAIIGPSILMLISFALTLLLTLKAWDHIELVNIIRKTLKEVHK